MHMHECIHKHIHTYMHTLWLKSVLETAMNFLQNKYNISRHFLRTLLHYTVKNKSFKML